MLTKDNKGTDFAYLFSERIAYRLFVNIFYKLPFSANQVTTINFFVNNLAAVILFALGRYWANLLGIFFIVLSVIWDWMDGAVARKKGSIGGGGGFLDAGLDFIWQHLLVAAIIFSVVVARGGDPLWLIIGLLAFVFLVLVNYFGSIYGENFGFGFRGDYDEFVKEVDLNKDDQISAQEWNTAVDKIEQGLLEEELKSHQADELMDVVVTKGDME